MAFHQPSGPTEETINLRGWLDFFLSHWKIILAVTAAFVTLSSVFSFLIQPTVYQSSVDVVIPYGTDDNDLGITAQDIVELGQSATVLNMVQEQLELAETSDQIKGYYSFEPDNTRSIRVTAKAETAQQAFRLADVWLQSYETMVFEQSHDRFDRALDSASQEVDQLLPQLTTAQEALDRFNLQNPPGRLETSLSNLRDQLSERENLSSRWDQQSSAGQKLAGMGGGGTPPLSNSPLQTDNLSLTGDSELYQTNPTYIELGQSVTNLLLHNLEQDLVETENRVRELAYTSIPISESRLALLEDALSHETPFLEQNAATSEGGGRITNPVYLDLSQQLANARITLEVERQEVEIQRKKISALDSRISQINRDLLLPDASVTDTGITSTGASQVETLELEITALRSRMSDVTDDIVREKFNRRVLENEVARLRLQYNRAKDNQTAIATMENALDSLYELTVVQAPSVPERPTSPQKGLNMTIALLLGLVTGVIVALLVDYHRGRHLPQGAPRG